MNLMLIFALAGAPDLTAPDAPSQNWRPWTNGVLVIAAAILVIFCLALAIIWAIKGRKTAQQFAATSASEPNNSSDIKNWLGFKKRHRKYKRRFPSLAENRGLPPKRTERQNSELSEPDLREHS
ncbi:MAG: hypothetical protein ACP5T0_11840 [Verrucomicrobiia bacterium]